MSELNNTDMEGIAIIGMAGRFPGAKTVAEFWQNLCHGVESISFFSDEELLAAGAELALVRNPSYVKAGGILGDADLLDAAFFGLNPREAALMDPQHRVFLECAWEAFEIAGYSPDHHKGRVGVFAGQSMNTYVLTNVYPLVAHVASPESLQASIGNDKDSLTTEVAYRLNLTGPAVTIQTSSSTSLAAVHYACLSLLNYECDMALAGGVSIHFPEKAGYMHYEGGTTSSDGHCRAFDAKADGFVVGHGAGVVTLKRLAEAVADGDTIYAVIKGSAVNNDGSLKVSYMAPTVDGQAQVIALAQAIAGVEPEDIGYIEAHGTATKLGDPIEIAAMTQAFRAGTDKNSFCAIGSVKTNIGHLDAAAGVVGLIKTALILKHKKIPPSLHFEQPNPNLDLAHSPFYVNAKLVDWIANAKPRCAGVNSWGMGGTNVHVVLEQAPEIAPSAAPRQPFQLLLLSAKTDTALKASTARLAEHLRQKPGLNLADAAFTLQVGRKQFNHRRMLVCRDVDDAVSVLSGAAPERLLSRFQELKTRPVMFMFSGQGAQYVNMGRGLYETEPLFRQHLDACSKLLKPYLELDLCSVLYPPGADAEQAALQLQQTALTQPALFAVEYAMAQQWLAWGVQPHAMIGHSIGEYVAACLAGVLTLEQALALVAARGRLMQQMPAGAMLAVPLSEQEVQTFLSEPLSLAAINSPSACIVAGPVQTIEALNDDLAARGVECTRLHTSHAFHSAMMEPILAPFREQMHRVKLAPPTLPYVSNVTGTWITADQATDPEYWVRHLRQTVRFADGVGELFQEPDAILLEVGPGQTLATLARQHPGRGAGHAILSSLRHPRETLSDVAFILTTLGRLWLAGVEPDWGAFYADEQRQRLSLPTYPYERQRCWVESKESWLDKKRPAPADQKLAVEDWFYLPSWKLTFAPKRASEFPKAPWLLFTDPSDRLAAALALRLAQENQEAITVSAGVRFEQLDEYCFVINPQQPADYESLLGALDTAGKMPGRIVHLWSVTSEEGCSDQNSFDQAQQRGFYSLLFLAQALGARNVGNLSITVVTQGALDVGGADLTDPEQATVLGLCKVIPQEYTNITCTCIDVAWPPAANLALDGWQAARLADQLLAECALGTQGEPVVAFRGRRRWVQTFEAVRPDGKPSDRTCLREKGVYLITGGLGNLGYTLAEALARRAPARLVLVGRSTLPAPETWPEWLAAHPEGDATSDRIRKVQALESLGAEVMVASADVANREHILAVISQAQARFGAIHGVIHAAGIVNDTLFKTIPDTRPADVDAHFAAKARGLYVLEDALRGQPLDFCLLASSLASVLGGLGLAGYAAANAFMDAFAHRHNQIDPVPWTSVNWDAWQFTQTEQQTVVGNPFAELSITTAEGNDAFRCLWEMPPAAQVAVSTSNLHARLARWVRLKAVRAAEGVAENDAQARAPRPNLQSAYAAPRDDIERAVTQVWEEILGIQQVGIYDNFFELGGNSLAGVQLIARLREKFNVQIPAVSLYEGPTVSALSKLIAQAIGGDQGGEPAYEASRSRGERRRERARRKYGE